LTPDNSTKPNALIRTSNGLHGVASETRSSEWELVAALAILVAGGVTLAAIDGDIKFTSHATVTTPGLCRWRWDSPNDNGDNGSS